MTDLQDVALRCNDICMYDYGIMTRQNPPVLFPLCGSMDFGLAATVLHWGGPSQFGPTRLDNLQDVGQYSFGRPMSTIRGKDIRG